ncbi:hypothetical protein EJ07DRAFT_179011 [Lizonia empirigonia]|nr:hypothetical protein EJ07DRAFT_179011 [Lizonia empirigonia]
MGIRSGSPRPLQQSTKPRTLSDVSPVPEISHASPEEHGAAAMLSLLPTPVSEPQSSDNAVSGSPWLWHGGAAAELAGYQPDSTDETSKAESSTSRQPTAFTGERSRKSQTKSPPLITDTNHGIPIVIYDTDEEINKETKEEINEEINGEIKEAKTDVTAFRKTSQLRLPKESRKRNLRKRARNQGATHGLSVQPQYEKDLLRKLRSAFYQHECQWMCVRELPEAVELATIEAHNEFVQDFGEVCRTNEAVFFKDARTLRTSFNAVSDCLLPLVHRGKDRDMIKKLGALVDEMQDHAYTLASIYAGGDDSDDDTYSPYKKRRL